MHADAERKMEFMVAAIRAISDGIDNAFKMTSRNAPEAFMAMDSAAGQARELLRYALEVERPRL